MAAKELLKVDFSHQDRINLRCRIVDTRNWPRRQSMFSSEFRFLGSRFKLEYSKCEAYYILFLWKCSRVAHRHPFFVSVTAECSDESGRIVNVLQNGTHMPHTFRGANEAKNAIWVNEEEDILQAVPEFRRALTLIVVLEPLEGKECTCATCKFTATDENVSSLESFSKDLGDRLDQDTSTDVEFRCADADDNILTTVKAHKFLVCARSPVLAAMLHSDMVEGRTGIATIKDIDAGVFKQFFKYLYSGKLGETTMDTAMSLYEAGDRFDVKSLTKHCAKRIARNLTIEKSCEVFLLAEAHCDEELADATVAFMSNRGVFDSWEDFCSKQLEPSNRILNRFHKLINRMVITGGDECCSKRRRVM